MNSFSRDSGPSGPPRTQPTFGTPPSFPSPPNPNPFEKKNDVAAAQSLTRQQPATPRPQGTPPQPERLGTQTSMVFQNGNAETSKRVRPPSLAFENNHSIRNPDYHHEVAQSRLGSQTNLLFQNGNAATSKRMRSPPLAFESNFSDPDYDHEEAQRTNFSPPTLGTPKKSPANYANSLQQGFHNANSYTNTRDAGTLSSPKSYFQALKTAGSPPLPSADVFDRSPDTRDAGTHSPLKPSYFNVPKRARSPPLPSADVLSTSSQLNSEREIQAKARRLARFNVELRQPTEKLHDPVKRKPAGNKDSQPSLDKWDADEHAEVAQDISSRGDLSNIEGSQSSIVVVGLCPDMCPESEREERERKGDLDQYERLDGERNQTSKFLAVKKYNRTAERQAYLIRPMPVLQKTVDYLLSLLDQPYNDSFLSIYNFLWDRMRAIRMDLRMQHIFNQQAIVMLEQMIRLHIIAMHELCEYKKGEGFSEGFDAHLNIEQMNKTSVELFQMYDDHRKKGTSVPSEKEFRGYYALLKLDKHPGYKVEPAELSLDLAKMTPGIRCSPEILFARDVARACRIGNYIAFFRLARKATYLQACLMHAHFAKLRTQALASLHSGLQNNQGIPVSHVVDWLGMEGEDTESLLEYHGFALKKYEEMYMVKEGPFLNSDVDFPTKRSHLVHLKKSKLIIDDAYSGSAIDAPVKSEMVSGATDMVEQNTDSSKTEVWINARDEEMLDFHKTKSAPKAATQPQPLIEVPSPVSVNRENDAKMTGFFLPRGFFLPSSSCLSVDNLVADNAQQGVEQMVESDGYISMDQRLPKSVGHLVQAETPESSECNYMTKKLTPPTDEIRMLDKEASMLIFHQNEVASEKLKLMLRKWKQWASKQREMREQREFLANAALSSLSLGPPVRQIKTPPRHATSELNIDNFARERYGRRGKSWSTLNVSELVAPVLSARNPDAKCLCWKLLIFVQANDTESQKKYLASRWLLSKLMGANKENEDLIVSLSHISIWKTWFATQNSPWTCCLSVIREATFDGNQQVSEDGIIAGTSCIMFLVSESIPWENQRVRLHNLLLSIPSGSNLPLLIFNSDAYEEKITDPSVTIISRLGLHNVDKSRIKSISVVSLVSECPQQHLSGFFSDDKLREGLRWLASHSPLQPAPSLVKTRESVLSYLRCSLEVLENRNATEVAPDCCISAFNEALDRLAEEILAAASKFPNPWPSPEINLLEKSSNEWMVAEMFLPSIGWSSPEGIEPLIRALKACKLPSFSDDFSWLKQGSHMGREIQHQKLEFEKRLFSYMTQLSQLLNADLAAREAAVLVQKGAGLELRGSHYYIIPRWVTIFRRIYNWRLKNLKTGEFSVAYVLEQHLERPSIMGSICRTGAFIPLKSNSSIEESGNYLFSSEGDQPVRSASDDLSFDEIVEVCCNVPHMEHQLPLPISECTPSGVHEAGCASEPTTGAKGNDKDYQTCGAHDDSLAGDRNKQRTLSPLSPKIDRLSVLLENCKRMQDTIDEKLAIYF